MTRQRLKKKPKSEMKKPRGWKNKLQKGFIQKKKEEMLRKLQRKQRKQLEKKLKKLKESSMKSYKSRKQRC